MGKLVKDMTPDERDERRAYYAAYYAAHRDERRARKAAYYNAEMRSHRTNARMARLGFAFADPTEIVAAIGNSLNNQQTKKQRKVA